MTMKVDNQIQRFVLNGHKENCDCGCCEIATVIKVGFNVECIKDHSKHCKCIHCMFNVKKCYCIPNKRESFIHKPLCTFCQLKKVIDKDQDNEEHTVYRYMESHGVDCNCIYCSIDKIKECEKCRCTGCQIKKIIASNDEINYEV